MCPAYHALFVCLMWNWDPSERFSIAQKGVLLSSQREGGAKLHKILEEGNLKKEIIIKKNSQQVPYMVRWGSASSLEQREWDQMPKFSLCQPIASRDMARDIWPCHRDACRWCISQLGSTLSSMKLWEWLQGGWVQVGKGGVRGRNTREREREGKMGVGSWSAATEA